MSQALALLFSVWAEVFGYLLAYVISSLLPALVLLAVGSLPLALALRSLLGRQPCNCC